VDVVSVNLSRADAALLLRVVEGELGGCACSGAPSVRCDACEALGAIRSDLRQMLSERRACKARSSAGISGLPVARTAGWQGLSRVKPIPHC
jgi:hypothetical protein